MPVVSASIAAVTAAITSVATVGMAASVGAIASAVATTGTLVGMAGLGVTAIGMATKDKGLLKAGKIMGFVGLGMGVTGWAVGALNSAGAFGTAADSADDLAAGALDDTLDLSDEAFDDAFREMGTANASAAQATGQAAGWKPGTMMTSDQALPADQAPSLSVSPDTKPVLDAQARYWNAAGPPGSAQSQGVINNAAPAPGTPAPMAPTAPPSPGGPTLQPMQQDPVGTINTPAPTTVVGGSRLDTGIQPFKAASFNIPPPPAGSGASGIASWWNSLNPNTQAALAISGGQAASGMVTGLYGGYLQGLADDERLEYQRQLDAWRQRNANYAPRVSFNRPGVLGRA